MKRIYFVLLAIIATGFTRIQAQQRIDPGSMNYIISSKPNNIIYRDTLYRGSRQFMHLFYRTRDQQLVDLYRRHQSNKIAGQVLGVAGTFATIFGVSMISSADKNRKGTGWVLAGGGFAALMTSGYLIMEGQKNLQMAVTIFNQRYRNAALGVGVSDNRAGLVYKF